MQPLCFGKRFHDNHDENEHNSHANKICTVEDSAIEMSVMIWFVKPEERDDCIDSYVEANVLLFSEKQHSTPVPHTPCVRLMIAARCQVSPNTQP